MIIKVADDFNPGKIQISGQCFRVKRTQEGVFRFITKGHVLYIKEVNSPADEESQDCTIKKGADNYEEAEKEFEVSCSKEEWETIWMPYFDMDRSYLDICKKEYGKYDFTDRAMDFGKGLRILKQDKWEMLISFIIFPFINYYFPYFIRFYFHHFTFNSFKHQPFLLIVFFCNLV